MDIDKVWHYSRYQHLLTLASLTRPVRTQSAAYRAPLYILSGSKELFEAARAYVSEDGINFDKIREAAKARNLGEAAVVAIDTAACLYYDPSERPIDWFGFSALDEAMLKIVLDALAVRTVLGLIPTCNEHGEMVLMREDL